MDAVTQQSQIITNIIDPVIASLCADSTISQPSIELDFKLSTKALRNMYSATTTDVIPFIEKHMLEYGINNKKRMSAFLSACFILSSGFRRKAESYSFTYCRLYKECDKVDSVALARRLVRNGEEEIANFLFSFENGNGGIDSNDGWMFRARTPLQFRGRTYYQMVHDRTGLNCVLHPELLEDPENSIIAAMAFWEYEGYNKMVDKLKFESGYELQVKARANGSVRNYRSNSMAVKMKKKLNNDTTGLIDFCEFIEMGMLYL